MYTNQNMPEFTKEEKGILKQYFTNTDTSVFCLINLPEVIKGTLFSRYSRSPKSVRRLFLDEFFLSEEVGNLFKKKAGTQDEKIDVTRAEDFYERILVGYGDDSIAELGGVHIAVENISNIVVKVIQDARIGISPLEKSSRYVFFDDKNDQGEYQYYRDPTIMKSVYGKRYVAFMDKLFTFYSKTVRDLFDYLMKTEDRPEGTSDFVFKASCRAKACDVVRYILPMSAYTNTGLYGNGRSFEYLLIKMLAHPLQEVRDTANQMNEELRKVIPAFVKRAANERGGKYQSYLQKTQSDVLTSANKYASHKLHQPNSVENSVKLVHYEDNPLDKIISFILFSQGNDSLNVIEEKVEKLTEKQKANIIQSVSQYRENRHHKPPRALENTTYTFEIVSDIGSFRDLHRHRMLSQERQSYTTDIGYTIPEEIEKVNLKEEYVELMEEAHSLYFDIAKKYPHEAQYVVPFGYAIRYYFTVNLREVVHLTELRSISQGHPAYREIAQSIAKAVIENHPYFEPFLGFVDYESYSLERLQAFSKIEEKAKKLGITAFTE